MLLRPLKFSLHKPSFLEEKAALSEPNHIHLKSLLYPSSIFTHLLLPCCHCGLGSTCPGKCPHLCCSSHSFLLLKGSPHDHFSLLLHSLYFCWPSPFIYKCNQDVLRCNTLFTPQFFEKFLRSVNLRLPDVPLGKKLAIFSLTKSCYK